MNSMKLRILAILLCIATVFTFVACNGKDGPSDTESSKATETEQAGSESGSKENGSAITEVPGTEITDIHEVTVEVNGESATVTSTVGLAYTAEGFTSVNDDSFVFTKGLTLTFPEEQLSEKFNRFTMFYSSTAPLHIYVTYAMGAGADKVDDYYLEAGQDVFSGLIVDYLDKKVGRNLKKIVIDTCKNEEASFALYHVQIESIEVYKGLYGSDTYYIDNGRFKLGVDMGWGGTVNYVEDMTKKVDGLTNLINKHDTGRLVQQSYYGTGAIEGVFEWGSFNGSDTWPYNPVQGGGQKNVASRLVDVVVGDNYVYIKAQPMDWGKAGVITPSYMENWYIIEDDYIRVDNRFVDFSGWDHPSRGQELPAFYTIGYLDSFVWYDGVDPWTGDELSWRHELRFWGDEEYASECRFRIKEPNTETWCAWVSTEDNYGIGLYSPNIDRYSAGRYQYVETLGVSTGTRGSKDPSANPTSYVAPWKQKEIVSFEAFEYSYLICAGSVDEIRANFTEYKDVIDNASLSENSVSNRQPFYEENMESIDFTVEGNEKFAAYPNTTEISYDKDMGALKLTMTGADPYVSIDYSASAYTLSAADYDYVELEYMIPTTNAKGGYSCQLFICADQRTSATATESVRSDLVKDGAFHVLRIKLSDKAYWKGNVNLIRLDYFSGGDPGDAIYIRSMKLSRYEGDELESIDFTKDGSMTLLSATKSTDYVFDEEVGATKLTVIGTDPSITVDYTILTTRMQASDYSKLRITYMVPAGQGANTYSYGLFPCSGTITAPGTNAQILSSTGIIADGDYHTLEFDLSEYDFWTGNINMIRFDYFNGNNVGLVFYITSLELVK